LRSRARKFAIDLTMDDLNACCGVITLKLDDRTLQSFLRASHNSRDWRLWPA
jgi:hypothetical protein